MNVLKTCPRVLLSKVLLTALIGTGCLIVGVAAFIFSGDKIMLALSGAVFVFSITKCVNLYHIIAKLKFERIEGTCVGVLSKPFSKLITVRVMDDNGIESSLHIAKQSRVKIGCKYRFYFKNSADRLSPGSEYFDTALSLGCFLGFEELGESGAKS